MDWFQLTYGSVERSAHRPGGWGTIQSTQGLPLAAEQRLLAGVVNKIDELVPTEEFALRRELDARVRCFSYRPEADGGTWWHAVVAGKDATGRPGNVFTHAATTERLDPGLRPVDLWRSKDWLTPFGTAEVAESSLGSAITSPPGKADGIAFALSHPQGAVEAVLAAVTACFEDHRALVLAVSSPDEFIDWVRAVSYLTSASVASQIPFSTFVRAEALHARTRQFEVLGMPREDLSALTASRPPELDAHLILDVAAIPEGHEGDQWQYAGQRWAGGERWLDAYNVLVSEGNISGEETVHVMDEITRGAVRDDQLSPEWPLALALLRRDGSAHRDADAIVGEWRRLQPFEGLTDPALLALLNPARVEQDSAFDDLLKVETEPVVVGPDVSDEAAPLTWAAYPMEWRDSVDREWQRSAPLFDLFMTSDAQEQEFVGDALLLSWGIGRPRVAGPTHEARVAELLGRRDVLPPILVGLLEDWVLRYRRADEKLPEGESE